MNGFSAVGCSTNIPCCWKGWSYLLPHACLSVGITADRAAAWKGGKEEAGSARALLSTGAPVLFTRPRSDSLLVSPAPAQGESLYHTEILSFPHHLHGACVTLAVLVLQLRAPILLKERCTQSPFCIAHGSGKLVLSHTAWSLVSAAVMCWVGRQQEQTNICIAGGRKVLTLSKVAVWSFAPSWLSPYRQVSSFGSGVSFIQLYMKGQFSLKKRR